jgi:hypothetical protein
VQAKVTPELLLISLEELCFLDDELFFLPLSLSSSLSLEQENASATMHPVIAARAILLNLLLICASPGYAVFGTNIEFF